jgi:hypothetical protein
MSADNFLVIREQPDGTFKVLEGRLSGWDDYLSSKPDPEIDAYLTKYAESHEGVFDSEDAAHHYCDLFESNNIVEYGREVHRRRNPV